MTTPTGAAASSEVSSGGGPGRVATTRRAIVILSGDAEEVAPRLLGWRLRSTIGGIETVGRIVEVEAYLGPHDPASHAAERIGRTSRNTTMFARAGTAYVYRSYGIHWCLNVVVGEEGFPAAVLLRGLEPLVGLETMRTRRGRDQERELCSGPGRLTQALGVTGDLDGHDLTRHPLELIPEDPIAADEIGVSGRIGVSRAAGWPLRFFLRESPFRSPRRGAEAGALPDFSGLPRAAGLDNGPRSA